MCFNTSQTEGQLNTVHTKKLRSCSKENKSLLYKGQYFFVIRITLNILTLRPKKKEFSNINLKC
jgi:hypothetical protein